MLFALHAIVMDVPLILVKEMSPGIEGSVAVEPVIIVVVPGALLKLTALV